MLALRSKRPRVGGLAAHGRFKLCNSVPEGSSIEHGDASMVCKCAIMRRRNRDPTEAWAREHGIPAASFVRRAPLGSASGAALRLPCLSNPPSLDISHSLLSVTCTQTTRTHAYKYALAITAALR